MDSSVAACPACAADVPSHHNFCGACGTPVRGAGTGGEVTLVKGAAPAPSEAPTRVVDLVSAVAEAPAEAAFAEAVPTPAATPKAKRRYRWPIRVSVVGAILLVIGSIGVTLLGTAIQTSATTDATGFGGSLLDTLLASFGFPKLGLGADEGTQSSVTLIAGIAISALVALVGAALLTLGVVWLLVRRFGGRGDGTFTARQAPPGAVRSGGPRPGAGPSGSQGAVVGGDRRPSGAVAGQQELRYQYERARPKIEAAARQSRETYRADIAPRLEQGAVQGKKAAAAALAKAREARERRNARG